MATEQGFVVGCGLIYIPFGNLETCAVTDQCYIVETTHYRSGDNSVCLGFSAYRVHAGNTPLIDIFGQQLCFRKEVGSLAVIILASLSLDNHEVYSTRPSSTGYESST